MTSSGTGSGFSFRMARWVSMASRSVMRSAPATGCTSGCPMPRTMRRGDCWGRTTANGTPGRVLCGDCGFGGSETGYQSRSPDHVLDPLAPMGRRGGTRVMKRTTLVGAIAAVMAVVVAGAASAATSVTITRPRDGARVSLKKTPSLRVAGAVAVASAAAGGTKVYLRPDGGGSNNDNP